MVVLYLKHLKQCVFIYLEGQHIFVELTREANTRWPINSQELSSNYHIGSKINDKNNIFPTNICGMCPTCQA